MKKLLSLLFVLLICLSLAGCGKNSSTPPRPKDSSLEFWIADSVKLEDFSGHDEVSGMFGGVQYLGTGYHAVCDEDGMNPSRPDACVLYTVTAYPDYSSGTLAVTGIEITDPAVTVYGLTVKSSPEEWDAVLREMGFEIRRNGLAEKDGFRFSYGGGEIRISAEVTNKQGIVF